MPRNLRRLLCLAILHATLTTGAFAQAPDAMAEARQAQAVGDHMRAIALLLPLAQAGRAEAQVRMGLIYYHGLGVREDDTEAYNWFSRAAAQGHADGQYHLANLYAFGHLPPALSEDADRLAARWYFESAQQGHPDAQYGLAIMFSAGKGVLQSHEEALIWFRRAAAAGHVDAKRFIDAR